MIDPGRRTSSSTLNWPVARANHNWAPSAGCTPSTKWSNSNWWRDTPSIPSKARSNNCCMPAKNTVGSDPGAFLAVLNRLIASWRSAGMSNSAAKAFFLYLTMNLKFDAITQDVAGTRAVLSLYVLLIGLLKIRRQPTTGFALLGAI
ncbi:hypothetical protein T265_13446, partial [Opisthorchis viverrini]